MTYAHTELDLEDSTTGNVSFVGSDRATVAGQRVIVRYVTGRAVSSSTYLDKQMTKWMEGA